ncbi:MAG: peptidase M23, partial [Gammaproteobacteria bacterium]|nr:peptidase M23 [Gammaproteobacteria bacterium]
MFASCIAVGLIVLAISEEPVPAKVAAPSELQSLAIWTPTKSSLVRSLPLPLVETVQPSDTVVDDFDAAEELENWQTLKVRRGDNLYLIFKRLGLSSALVHRIMRADEASVLKNLLPGQELHILLEDGAFRELIYDIDPTHALRIRSADERFSAEIAASELETRIATAAATISSSLFEAAQDAGLSDRLTLQLVHLFGWDIDFALDIREGDRFALIFEEQFKDGEKVRDGTIVAAEFVNRGKTYLAVRYTNAEGYTDYYSEGGQSMRKAFLRTPLDFTRISSRFSLKRKHPILNRIRAHRG